MTYTKQIRDPKVISQMLPNGSQLFFRNNTRPEGKVYVGILVAVGSKQEEKHEEGMAHLLEHLCFSGNTKYTREEIQAWYVKAGLRFGGDANAYTTVDHTLYHLELPNDPTVVAEAIELLHLMTSESLISDKAFLNEQKIVQEEMRARDSLGRRAFKSYNEALFAGTSLEHAVSGTHESVEAFTRDSVWSFYKKWYTPARLSLIVVGDIDQELVVHAAVSAFAAPDTPAIEMPDLAVDITKQPTRYTRFTDPELTEHSWATTFFFPYLHIDTKEDDLVHYAMILFSSCMAIRTLRIAKDPRAQLRRFDFSYQRSRSIYSICILSISGLGDDPFDSLESMITEQERLVRFGITEQELHDAIEKTKLHFESAIKEEDARETEEHFEYIVENLVDHEVIETTEQSYEDFMAFVPELTRERVMAVVERIFANASQLYYAKLSPADYEKLSDGDFQKRVEELRAEPVEKPVERVYQELSFALKPAASYTKHAHGAPLDLVEYTFENGIQAYVKHWEKDPDTDQVEVCIYDFFHKVGKESKSELIAIMLLSKILSISGVGIYSNQDISYWCEKSYSSLSYSQGAYFSLICNLSISPTNLTDGTRLFSEVLLSLLHDHIKEEDFAHTKMIFAQQFRSMWQDGKFHFDMLKDQVLTPDLTWMHAPTEEDIVGTTYEDLKHAIEIITSEGKVVLNAVSNYETDKVAHVLAQTLAYLPRKKDPLPYEQFAYTFPKGSGIHELTFGHDEGARGTIIYGVPFDFYCQDLVLFGNVFQEQLREVIRESYGDTYYIGVSTGVEEYLGVVHFEINWTCKSSEARKIGGIVREELAKMLIKGVDADILHAMISSRVRNVTANMESADFWLQMRYSNRYDLPLDYTFRRLEQFATATPDRVNAYARKSIDLDTYREFYLYPEV